MPKSAELETLEPTTYVSVPDTVTTIKPESEDDLLSELFKGMPVKVGEGIETKVKPEIGSLATVNPVVDAYAVAFEQELGRHHDEPSDTEAVNTHLRLLAQANSFFNVLEEVDPETPRADVNYRHLFARTFTPTLRNIEQVSGSADLPTRTRYLEGLLVTLENGDGLIDGDYERYFEVIQTMLRVGRAEAFPYVLKAYEHFLDSDIASSYRDFHDHVDSGVLGYSKYTPQQELHHLVVLDASTTVNEEGTEREACVKFLTQLMAYESYGCSRNYAEAFEKLGVEISYPFLLRNLRSDDELTRRMSAEVLYRLEMGKIGITSKEGVEYFDKVYRLAKEDDPDFFVRLYRQGNAYIRRIDSSGTIGVFDGREKLLGRFQLRLEAEEEVVTAPVHEVISKDVFLPKADETSDQRRARESMLELYLASYGKLYDQLEGQTGVRLSSLDLHEQGWFITYFSTSNPQQQRELIQFIKTYGELGLKAFLALDYGESGEAIMQYARESAGTEGQQKELFMQFHRIAVSAMEWRRVFEQAETSTKYKFSAEIHEALIRKASEYFRAALLIEQGGGGKVTRQELMQSMSQITFALEALRGLYGDDSALVLETPKGQKGANPQVRAEKLDKEGKYVVEDALTTWTLIDARTGTRVIVSVRPQATQAGEARLNFRVVNESGGIEARIGVDLGDWGVYSGNTTRPYAVSLDLGTGHIDKENRIYPSQRVGEILNIVEGSEGGHNEASFSIEAVGQFEAVAQAFTGYMEQRFPAINSRS